MIMEKRAIVKELFKQGTLVTPGLLGTLDEKNLNAAISSPQTILDFVPESLPVTRTAKPNKTLTVEDITHFYKEKYNGLKAILSQKISPTSISNVPKNFTTVSLIGMVSEHTPSGFVLEDPTGRLEVLAQDSPDPGDVVGVTGNMRDSKLHITEMLWPDIPLPKIIKTPKITLLLTQKPLQEQGTQLVCGKADASETLIPIPTTPAKLTLSGLEVVVSSASGNPLEWLKKRHLPGPAISPHDFYLLQEIPDILWVIGEENKTQSYKGVTIVQTSPDSYAILDMSTRTVEFKSLPTSK